ncbi:MAG: hypothetical protein WB755_09900 [Terriglobales bacterium]
MPSFVYVARVAHLSEKQAEDLRSAGFHVKAFGPGEITADDCLLVMTSEALLARPYQTDSDAGAGATAEPDEKCHIPSVPDMAVPDMNEQLGPQAAIWHIIKTRAKETAAEHEESSRRKPVAEPEIVDLGLIPTASGMRALSALRPESEAASGPLPTGKNAPPGNSGKGHFSPPFMLGADFRGIRSADAQHHKPWRPMATVATLLICAVVLLTHRAATVPLTNESGRVDSESANSVQTVSSHTSIQPSGLTSSSTEASRVSTGVRRHPVDYDFIAEDFTKHFDVHAHNRATLQTPQLKHNGSSGERKRVVNN